MADKLRGSKGAFDLAAELAAKGDHNGANEVMEMADTEADLIPKFQAVVDAALKDVPEGDKDAMTKVLAPMAEVLSSLLGKVIYDYSSIPRPDKGYPSGLDETEVLVMAVQSITGSVRQAFANGKCDSSPSIEDLMASIGKKGGEE